jgi:hypothetical protein
MVLLDLPHGSVFLPGAGRAHAIGDSVYRAGNLERGMRKCWRLVWIEGDWKDMTDGHIHMDVGREVTVLRTGWDGQPGDGV